ncbi:hypothetical protein NSPZN2_10126 [Nitrospira defluvii]|uniref:Uncharacterized protein n=1 Tax=Nitrospira defluvii TaxID=330214 RepID=A0ABM8QCB4_9BACT|nr:hypothetical protein NSPZN2_10126 [Nitrospira defluvii]
MASRTVSIVLSMLRMSYLLFNGGCP